MAAPAGSLTLNEAYRMALAHSEQVQEAIANLRIAEDIYTDALTVVGPKLSVTGSALYENAAAGTLAPGHLATGQQPPYGTQIEATLSQPILRRYLWDQRRAGKLGIVSSDATVLRAKQQLMFDVTTAFIGVMQNRQQYIIAEGAVKRATLQLQNAETRVNSGGELATAKFLAQVDLNRAQIQLNTADGSTQIVESQLQRLIGMPPPETLLLPPTPQVEALADVIEHSRKERADLKVAALRDNAGFGDRVAAAEPHLLADARRQLLRWLHRERQRNRQPGCAQAERALSHLRHDGLAHAFRSSKAATSSCRSACSVVG